MRSLKNLLLTITVPMLLAGLHLCSSSASAAQPDQDDSIDLSHWKLTLPTDESGDYEGHPAEKSPKQLTDGFKDSHFQIDSDGSLVFWCPVNGAKTEGTDYPRSELREMLSPDDPSVNWTSKGTHTLAARCRVLEVPSDPKVVIGQIHGYSGKARPLIKLQYFKGKIEALIKTSPNKGKDQKMTFGEVGLDRDIAWEIKLKDGVLDVTVNGKTQSMNIVESDAEWGKQTFYFKAGVYPMDNEGPATEGARVSFSELKVSHTE